MEVTHPIVNIERYSQDILAPWLFTEGDVGFLAVLELVDHELNQRCWPGRL